jgi:lipoprotein-anchoring transpeptidase ErfK/SrfK
MISINGRVGKGCINNKADVNKVIGLLTSRKNQSAYSKAMSEISIPSISDDDFDGKFIDAIKLFQKKVQKLANPDGMVFPNGSTILYLGGVRTSGKSILVDLDDQNLYAYEGNRLIHTFYCASGDKVHPTATWPSLYKIIRKYKIYRSRKYDAQMNYAMFFTVDGKAIHQSNAVGLTSVLKNIGINALGSHGCVRLSEENASTLFNWAPMSTPVFVDLEMI